MKNNIKFKRIIYIVLITIIIISLLYIIKSFALQFEAIEESQLLNNIEIDNKLIEEHKEDIVENDNEEDRSGSSQKQNEQLERMLKIQSLQEENSDIVGWVEIQGTNINYPVLQGKDNEYYLTHNYKKEKSEKGSIFLSKDYDWSLPSNNLLIYGHNLINGQMFKDLLKYSDEEFYKKHSTIRFTTNNKDTEFEIISAFKSRVYYKTEKNVFRYYDFINAKSKEEYDKFIKKSKKASLYETGNTAKYGDQLITLITCSYHTDNGRFVVIGREK